MIGVICLFESYFKKTQKLSSALNDFKYVYRYIYQQA